MNKICVDILLELVKNSDVTQRQIANHIKQSLGAVNKAIHQLESKGYLCNYKLTEKAENYLKQCKPDNAIILAAGIGLRMTPINHNSSKGMLVIKGKTIVENMILQLHEKGINEIILVVGFMKEQYEELAEHYNVKLIVNHHYQENNNLYSLYLARKHFHRSYVLPCDVWCEENFFSEYEPYSWYLFDSFTSLTTSYGFGQKIPD